MMETEMFADKAANWEVEGRLAVDRQMAISISLVNDDSGRVVGRGRANFPRVSSVCEFFCTAIVFSLSYL